jgi:uncharacterized damage-inducible protein DinB
MAAIRHYGARGGTVKLTDLLIAEIDREAPLTRRALEVYPEGRDDWKPHAKSMPFGRLASLIAMMPAWMTMEIEEDEYELMPASGVPSKFAQTFRTGAELVKAADDNFASLRKALQATTDEHLLTSWRLKAKGNVVSEGPRYVLLRETLMHISHHRGQLTVYLRLNDVKVPSIYGPSADEQRF